MKQRLIRRVLALSMGLLLLSGCASGERSPEVQSGSDALTWFDWSGYDHFLALAAETYPDISLEISTYAGSNRTGYSWAQMRGDDIPDIFITSQILDKELAKERLADLSGCDFVNRFSTSLLDQVAIDGGVYLLPVNNTMYGIYYNKTLMEEYGWQVPENFAGLKALCEEIRAAGLIPGVVGTELTGNTFSAVFNLAKTSWLTTPEGRAWEQAFLAGDATAAGMWEDTMDYVQQYIDIGMFETDPGALSNSALVREYLGGRKAVFCTATWASSITELESGDQLGLMPYIGEDGSKNIYMYNPSSYIGISKRLTQPGNEQKLEDALKLLSLIYTPEGQAAFQTESTPCVLSVLDSAGISEDSMIYDAWRALREGRAFPMTYARWENVLADIGQAYKDWFRGENGMDGPGCIARMDELQSNYLSTQNTVYFCESTASFTLEETARLVGKALGSAVGADAAMIFYAETSKPGAKPSAGVTGKLYQDRINTDVSSTILPGVDGEYAILTMTGGQAKELEARGFDLAGDGDPYPYLLVVKGGGELEEDKTYRVAFLMKSYTEEVGERFSAQVEKGSVSLFLREWLTRQKTVSPDGNPWS